MIPYIIKSFRGGVSDENDKGVAGSFKFGYALDIHSRDDALRCKSTMATIDSTVVTDLIKWFVASSVDGSTYAFGDAGKIYSIAGMVDDPAVVNKYTDSNGNIKGAAEWTVSEAGSTATYLIWATDTSISRKIMPGDDAWGDVVQNWKTNLDPAEWHTMAMGGGQLNIANGQYLASIGYDEAYTNAALGLRPLNLIKALEERDDYVILGSFKKDNSEEGHIWSWMITSTNYIQKKRIPIKGVNAMINAELMLLQGGDDGELFFSDFVNATPLMGVPGGGQVYPGGVTIENDLAAFGFFGGTYPGIWSYGRKRKNRPFALNYDYRLTPTVGGSTVSTIGAIKVVNDLMLASWGTTDGSTTDYGLDMVSSTSLASANYEGLEFDAGVPHSSKHVDTVKAVMAPMPSGTIIAVKFKLEKESAWRYGVTGGAATTFSVTGATEAIFGIGKPGTIYEVGAELTPSAGQTIDVLALVSYLRSGFENVF